jgi:signal peptidase complex subunit 3
MHNSLTRAQNVFGFFTTVACVFAAFIAATDFFAIRNPSGSITPQNIQVYDALSPTPRSTIPLQKANAIRPSPSVKGRPHYYSTKKEEYAVIRFSLDADLSSLFTWNTKQVFVYVTAEWSNAGDANNTNTAVIWDSIITNPSADHLLNVGPATLKKLKKGSAGKTIDPSRGLLKLKNQRPKYQITHPSGKIAQTQDVVLKLHYNVQPWVGLLTWDLKETLYAWKPTKGGLSNKFKLPAIKNKDEKAKRS